MDINQVIKSSHSPSAGQDAATALYRGNSATTAQDTGSNDSLMLSQEGVFLNDLAQGKLEWGKEFKTVPPVPRTAEELTSWFNDYQEAVRKHIQEIFQLDNIQLAQPITLQAGTDGGVAVNGDHPQAQDVQQAIGAHPAINSMMQSLNQRSELFNVLGHGNDLRQAGNDDERSQAETALSKHLSTPPTFSLTLNTPAAEPTTTRA